MTDLLNPADTGEIPAADTRAIFHHTADTAVIPDATRNLGGYILPPTAGLRRAEASPDEVQDTGEVPAWPTGAELAASRTLMIPSGSDEGPPPTMPTPPPPKPSWAKWPAEYPGFRIVEAESVQVRPPRYRPEHRMPAPWWAWLLADLGACMIGSAIGTAVMLVLAVAQ